MEGYMFARKSEKTAIITMDSEISYNQMIGQVYKYSKLIGDAKDKRILVISENRPEYIYAVYGIWLAGGTAVPVDFMSVPNEIAYIIDDCKPTMVFTSKSSLKNVEDSISAAKHKEIKINVFEELSLPEETSETEDIDFDDRERTALLIYTSGTTGDPKGVMLSFTNLLSNVEKVVEAGYYKSDDTALMILPLHHIFPLMGTMVAVFSGGGATAIVPSLKSEDIMAMMAKSKPTMIIGVPRFYEMLVRGIMNKINGSFVAKNLFKLAKALNSLAFSRIVFKSVSKKFGGHVRFLISGGAKLDPSTWHVFKTLGFVVAEGYGMTEAAPMITFPRHGEEKAGSVGSELEKGCVKIVDGEIVTKGRNIMKGYYNKPEETAEVLKDGWLYTGDLGEFDKQGRLYITGRKKELIVLPSGKNISPHEVEKGLESQSDLILEAAIMLKNNALSAILRLDEELLAERQVPNIEEFARWEIIDRYNTSASHHKKILDFILIKEPLPRTRLGKLQRFKLDDFLKEKDESKKTVETPEDESYKEFVSILKKFTDKEVSFNDHIEIDLGFDSLDKIELAGAVSSKWGVKLSEEDLAKNSTVEKLYKFIKENEGKPVEKATDLRSIIKENVNLDLPKSAFYHRWIRFYLSVIVRFFFRIRHQGMSNIPKSPFILAPNHQSFIDGLFVVMKLKPSEFKKVYFFAKEKHFKRGWKRYLANRNNIIIMKDGEGVADSLKKMAQVLKKGRSVIIFPEGTRTRDGMLNEFKQSFALLACELNIPVVPVAIKGAYEAFPKGRKIPHPFKRVDVEYLPHIIPEGYTKDELADKVKRSIERVLERNQ